MKISLDVQTWQIINHLDIQRNGSCLHEIEFDLDALAVAATDIYGKLTMFPLESGNWMSTPTPEVGLVKRRTVTRLGLEIRKRSLTQSSADVCAKT